MVLERPDIGDTKFRTSVDDDDCVSVSKSTSFQSRKQSLVIIRIRPVGERFTHGMPEMLDAELGGYLPGKERAFLLSEYHCHRRLNSELKNR